MTIAWGCDILSSFQRERKGDCKMIKVINKNGTEIDYEAALALMDEDIVDRMADEWYKEYYPCNNQHWFTRYESLHEQKYGEEWELSKANPTY